MTTLQVRPAHAVHRSEALGLRTVTIAERPDLAGGMHDVITSRWPTFMLAGRPGHDVDLVRMLMTIPQHQILLVDPYDNVHGVGLSVPLQWDRTVDGLPAGWDGAINAGAELIDRGGIPNVVSALSITLSPSVTGRGLAAGMIEALKRSAAAAGASALIAPIRPVLKSRYPLTPMVKYLTWRTDDGQIFDPWLRLHLRLGGVQIGIAYPSMTVTGSVAQWQEWTELSLPAGGEYVIPDGLVPLVVDRRAGTAVYREPNVWIAHRTDRG